MKKILLICNQGASTSLVVQRMQEYTESAGIKCEIRAVSLDLGKDTAADYDVLLLGPQVRHEVKKFKALFPDKPVDSIVPMAYGRADGEAVFKQAKELWDNK